MFEAGMDESINLIRQLTLRTGRNLLIVAILGCTAAPSELPVLGLKGYAYRGTLARAMIDRYRVVSLNDVAEASKQIANTLNGGSASARVRVSNRGHPRCELSIQADRSLRKKREGWLLR